VRAEVLYNAEETFRIFYKMAEEILTLKEDEEKARQAEEDRSQRGNGT